MNGYPQPSTSGSYMEVVESDQPDIVLKCVRYILCRDGNKVPLKRADIAKHLSLSSTKISSEFKCILQKAQRVLKEVYGYELVEEHDGSVTYMVVLAEGEQQALLPTTVWTKQQQRLLNVVLTHIFMSGGSVNLEDMWEFLKKAELMDDNSKKIVTDRFVSQKYVKITQTGVDTTKECINWGSRAIAELPKKFVLDKCARALGKPPEYWNERYNEVQQELRAQAGQPTQAS